MTIDVVYKHESKFCSPDGDTNFFNLVARDLQRDKLAPYSFILYLDYILQMFTDLIKENSLSLKKKEPIETMAEADYTDDPALLTNTLAQGESLLHDLKQAVGGIGFFVNANKTEYVCFKQN